MLGGRGGEAGRQEEFEMHSWDFMQEKNEQPDVLFLCVWLYNLVRTRARAHTHTHTHTLTHSLKLTSYSLGVFRNNSQGFLTSPGV